ncbi:MAG TPA: GGDEF domain-containing protein [Patescibacteria group bacterium]|nr:GGDEF domain-containing protein [Patescibacteria group bacterium]
MTEKKKRSGPSRLNPHERKRVLREERLSARRDWVKSIFDQIEAGDLTSDGAQEIIARTMYAQDIRLEHNKRRSQTDLLTGLANKDSFRTALHQATLSNRPFALLIIDVDDFKDINDKNGHSVADNILVQIGLTLSSKTKGRKENRSEDVVARWGGDEYAILLYDVADEETLFSIAERQRRAIAAHPFLVQPFTDDQERLRISATVSVGGGLYKGGRANAFFAHVDSGLYEVKRQPDSNGVVRKNRTVIV